MANGLSNFQKDGSLIIKENIMLSEKRLEHIYNLAQERFPGCVMIKQYQTWGECPTFKKSDGNVVYCEFFQKDEQEGEFVFLTWLEMRQYLKENWRPSSQQERDWFLVNFSN
jgi:hypothetical protein